MIARTLSMQRGHLLALAAPLVAALLLCGCSDGSYAENTELDQGNSSSSPAEIGSLASESIRDQSNQGQSTAIIADPGDQIAIAGPGDQIAQANPSTIRILALGDSLTAGYGLDDLSLAFPARLEQELKAAGYDVDVLDAGISGDTSAGGRSRLDWSLTENPDAVIVELGANDGLRAIDPGVTYDNLNNILGRLAAQDTPVLLAGMLAPPNLGREYGERFAGVYQRLAKEYDVVFYPFFLDGVAGDPTLNQDDRIHPNEAGVNIIVDKIKPFAEQLVERVINQRSPDSAS